MDDLSTRKPLADVLKAAEGLLTLLEDTQQMTPDLARAYITLLEGNINVIRSYETTEHDRMQVELVMAKLLSKRQEMAGLEHNFLVENEQETCNNVLMSGFTNEPVADNIEDSRLDETPLTLITRSQFMQESSLSATQSAAASQSNVSGVAAKAPESADLASIQAAIPSTSRSSANALGTQDTVTSRMPSFAKGQEHAGTVPYVVPRLITRQEFLARNYTSQMMDTEQAQVQSTELRLPRRMQDDAKRLRKRFDQLTEEEVACKKLCFLEANRLPEEQRYLFGDAHNDNFHPRWQQLSDENADRIVKTIHDELQWDTIRPLQVSAINACASGRDVVLQMSTSGGKSCVCQVAAIVRPGIGIVISPLNVISIEQLNNLRNMGIETDLLIGHLDDAEKARIIAKITENPDKVKFVIMAPEYLKEGERGRNLIEQLYVMSTQENPLISCFIIEECHAARLWYQFFRKAYRSVFALRNICPTVPIIACSATMSAAGRAEIIHLLQLNDPVIFLSSVDRPNLQLQVIDKRHDDKVQTLEIIRRQFPGQKIIIICRKIIECDALAAYLYKEAEIKSSVIYSEVDPADKDKRFRDWNTGVVMVMIATNAIEMGMDVANVRGVIYNTLPQTHDNYAQGIGRAGRDGQPATCVVMYCRQDVEKIQKVLVQENHDDRRRDSLGELGLMAHYCSNLEECRRKALATHYGQIHTSDLCIPGGTGQMCDNCAYRVSRDTIDVAVVAEAILELLLVVEYNNLYWNYDRIFGILNGTSNVRECDLEVHDVGPFAGFCGKVNPRVFEKTFNQLIHTEKIHIVEKKQEQMGTYGWRVVDTVNPTDKIPELIVTAQKVDIIATDLPEKRIRNIIEKSPTARDYRSIRRPAKRYRK